MARGSKTGGDDYDFIVISMYVVKDGKIAVVFKKELMFDWDNRDLSETNHPFCSFNVPSSVDPKWIADTFTSYVFDEEEIVMQNRVQFKLDVFKEGDQMAICVETMPQQFDKFIASRITLI